MKNTIFLIGYMGSGKSVIGRELSKAILYSFYDLDNFVTTNEGLTINQIFEQKDELYFRKIERKYLKELIKKDEDKVISLGGGTPCYSNNMDLILKTTNSDSIYLNRPIDFLVDRLFHKISFRPLIAHLKSKEELKEFISKHLFERNQYYSRSKKILKTNNLKIDEVIKELKLLLG
jgi:shikimate kinase